MQWKGNQILLIHNQRNDKWKTKYQTHKQA